MENPDRLDQESIDIKVVGTQFVSIPKGRFEELQEKEALLECLQACGVDNWSGYPDAYEMYEGT